MALKYAVQISGVDELAIMKGDVLAGFSDFKVCVAYQKPNGQLWTSYPSIAEDLDRMTPVYETVAGWKTATPDDANYLKYLTYIEKFVGVPVKYVGYGPEREAMVVR